MTDLFSDLMRMLHDPNPEWRIVALTEIGQWGATHQDGGREAMPFIVKRLGDPERDVRKSAAYALGAIGDAEGVEALLALLDEEDDTGLQLVAIKALGKIGAGAASEGLITTLQAANSRCIAVAAAKALQRIGSKAGREAVEAWERDTGDGARHER